MRYSLLLNESNILDKVGGIDKIENGLLCVLKLNSTIDNSSSNIVCLVNSFNNDEFGTAYDVYIWTKWDNGSYSGAIKIKDLCVWRYITDIVPPNEFITACEKGNLNCLLQSGDKIHYYDGDRIEVSDV